MKVDDAFGGRCIGWSKDVRACVIADLPVGQGGAGACNGRVTVDVVGRFGCLRGAGGWRATQGTTERGNEG